MSVGLENVTQLPPIDGVQLATCAAGICYADRDDLVLLTVDEGSHTALVQTQNRFCAAPVQVTQSHHQSTQPRAFLINAGNANAGTGQAGLDNAHQCCELVATELGLSAEQVLPFSTGVIGQHLPMERFIESVPTLKSGLNADGWVAAANAIMTTDTVAKGASLQVEIDNELVTLTGIAKGSGMIHPDMATLLAFIATDAPIAPHLLQQSLEHAVMESFNCITVDGDTSTNDACSLTATGAANISLLDRDDSPGFEIFQKALNELTQTLAKSIVRDAEGATKFVGISVSGTRYEDCKVVANTIALSPLVKTALFASDPNWGRILAAIGRAQVPGDAIDMAKVSIIINQVSIVRGGEIAPDYQESNGQNAFDPPELTIDVVINDGDQLATVWTSDLSHEYVSINADYRS